MKVMLPIPSERDFSLIALFTEIRWRALANARVLEGSNKVRPAASSSFLFRPGLGFRGRWRRGLSCEPLGFQTLAVLRECGLGDLVLAHCRCGIYLAKRLARFPLGPGDLLWWVNFARCLRHFFAFGRSTRASLNSSGSLQQPAFTAGPIVSARSTVCQVVDYVGSQFLGSRRV
jgi:hypothetical protein